PLDASSHLQASLAPRRRLLLALPCPATSPPSCLLQCRLPHRSTRASPSPQNHPEQAPGLLQESQPVLVATFSPRRSQPPPPSSRSIQLTFQHRPAHPKQAPSDLTESWCPA